LGQRTSIFRLPPRGRLFWFNTAQKGALKDTEIGAAQTRWTMMMAEQALYQTYNRAPLRFDRGEGCWLITENGERYLDFAAGVAVNSIGHCHPHLVEAVSAQARKLWHVSNIYQIPGQERLAERLCAATFAERVFFTNSGAEALECLFKTARRYHYAKGNPERYRIITFEGAFHGRTLAAIAAGGQAKYLEGFGPKVEGFDQVPFGDHDALKAAITSETAGILIEPIQGEGGIRLVPNQCLQGLRALCDEHGILLLLDEVQTGIGRTGTFLAHEHAGIAPDIVAIAKGIGGGFPLGACLSTAEAASGMVAGTHGTTYGGNPLAMAAGNAVLDVILADGFMEAVSRKGLALRQGLESVRDRFPKLIAEVRGFGLHAGLKCVVPNTTVIAACRDQHLLSVAAGDNVVRLMPPLTVSEEELRDAVHRLEAALATL
jgi:acetylornithine/N-succinyldiaminopimelate aminotransferase